MNNKIIRPVEAVNSPGSFCSHYKLTDLVGRVSDRIRQVVQISWGTNHVRNFQSVYETWALGELFLELIILFSEQTSVSYELWELHLKLCFFYFQSKDQKLWELQEFFLILIVLYL